MNDVMLDLETLGKEPGCVILSIGAVKFDLGGIRSEFECFVSLESSMEAGFRVNAQTLKWWLKQSDEARAGVGDGCCPVREALGYFHQWLGAPHDCRIWGNGAVFDNAILSSAYRWLGMEVPWKFWNDRCYRTIKECVPDIKIQRQGTHHNALHDAKSQALHLIEIAKNVVWVNEAFKPTEKLAA